MKISSALPFVEDPALGSCIKELKSLFKPVKDALPPEYNLSKALQSLLKIEDEANPICQTICRKVYAYCGKDRENEKLIDFSKTCIKDFNDLVEKNGLDRLTKGQRPPVIRSIALLAAVKLQIKKQQCNEIEHQGQEIFEREIQKKLLLETQNIQSVLESVKEAFLELEMNPVKHHWESQTPTYYYVHTFVKWFLKGLNQALGAPVLNLLRQDAADSIHRVLEELNSCWETHANEKAYACIQKLCMIECKNFLDALLTPQEDFPEALINELTVFINEYLLDEDGQMVKIEEVSDCLKDFDGNDAIIVERGIQKLFFQKNTENGCNPPRYVEKMKNYVYDSIVQVGCRRLDRCQAANVIRQNKKVKYDNVIAFFDVKFGEIQAHLSESPVEIDKKIITQLIDIKAKLKRAHDSLRIRYRPDIAAILTARGYQICGDAISGREGRIIIIRKNGMKYAAKVFEQEFDSPYRNFSGWIARTSGDAVSVGMSHPNLLKLHEVIADDTEIRAVIYPYMGGGDLLSFEEKNHPKDYLKLIQSYSKQILEALAFLHGNGIIHYDVKLDNIFVSETGESVKLADFGTLWRNPGRQIIGMRGTPPYAAPEVILNLTKNEKVDMWSFGVVLFSLVTGCLPYTIEEHDTRFIIQNKINNRLKAINDDVLRSLIEGCFKINPDERLSALEALNHVFFQLHISV